MMKHCYLLLLLAGAVCAKEGLPPQASPNQGSLFEAYPNLRFLEQQQIYAQPEKKPPIPAKSGSLALNRQQLQTNPALLKAVMIALIRQNNITGIAKILSLYRQSPQANPDLIAYADGLLFLHNGQAGKSVRAFKPILQRHAEAEVAGYYYSLANFYNKNYRESRTYFARLKSVESLPEEVQQQIGKYEQWINDMARWQANLNFSLFYDRNINNAPDNPQWGNFRFAEKKADTGLMYQFALAKKMLLPQGFYLQPNANVYGKQYRRLRAYNDTNFRFALPIAYANQYHNLAVQPYFARRLYGEKAYSATFGSQLNWQYDWHRRFASLISLAYEQQYFDRQPFLNNHRQIANITLLYALTPRHSLSLNPELVHQYATRDRDDRYWGWTLKADWRANWHAGFATTLTALYGKQKYKGSTLLTQFANRQDHYCGITLQLKHQKLQYAGFQPALTLQYYVHHSNSPLHSYRRQDIFVNLHRLF